MTFENVVEVRKEKPLFQLFFLKEDRAQGVEVEEIDFREVEKHLEQGESVLIKPKHRRKPNASSLAKESTAKPWFFQHV